MFKRCAAELVWIDGNAGCRWNASFGFPRLCFVISGSDSHDWWIWHLLLNQAANIIRHISNLGNDDVIWCKTFPPHPPPTLKEHHKPILGYLVQVSAAKVILEWFKHLKYNSFCENFTYLPTCFTLNYFLSCRDCFRSTGNDPSYQYQQFFIYLFPLHPIIPHQPSAN